MADLFHEKFCNNLKIDMDYQILNEDIQKKFNTIKNEYFVMSDKVSFWKDPQAQLKIALKILDIILMQHFYLDFLTKVFMDSMAQIVELLKSEVQMQFIYYFIFGYLAFFLLLYFFSLAESFQKTLCLIDWFLIMTNIKKKIY